MLIKTLLTTLFILLISMVTLSAQSKKKEILIKTKVYCDHCVKCESCKSRVENKVYELKGVRFVDMNPKNETIKVVYNPKTLSEQKIKEQINLTGYDADELKASQAQIAGLDDCCRK